jgi:hypothetical protein
MIFKVRALCVPIFLVCLLQAAPAAAEAAPARLSSMVAAPNARPALHVLLPHDSALHLLAGAASGLLSASIFSHSYQSSTIQEYPLLLPAAALTAAVFAGFAKESVDSTGFGDPQWRDLRNTALGGTAAALLVGGAETAFGNDPQGRRTFGIVCLAAGAFLSIPVMVGLRDEIVTFLHRR